MSLAKLLDGVSRSLDKSVKALHIVKHMVSKIDLVLVLAKLIGKVVSVDRVKPVPIFKIVADGRAEIAKTVLLKMEGDGLALRTLNAKRPVEPVLCRIAKLVLDVNVGLSLFLYCYVSTNKILSDDEVEKDPRKIAYKSK